MRSKLLDKLENVNDLLIAMDLDGTISTGDYWGLPGEPEPQPIPGIVDLMRKWYVGGAHIIIYTARQPKDYPMTHGWLVKHQVPFHGIAMTMKPGADIYIDDKTLNAEDLKHLISL